MSYLTPDLINEQRNEVFKEAVRKGVETALNRIMERYEQAEDPENNLAYHNSEHTQSMLQRVEKIMAASGASERDIKLATLAGAFHDTVQNWERRSYDTNGAITDSPEHAVKVLRIRDTHTNEQESVGEVLAFMREANEQNPDTFTELDMATVSEAILATIPQFDSASGTVVQPVVDKNSYIIARSIALADIGTAGMEEPHVFLAEGNAIFREDNLDIAALNSETLENLSEKRKQHIMDRAYQWTASQASFARGRQQLLDKELEGLPEYAQQQITKLFNRFDDSIHAAEQLTAKRLALKDSGHCKELLEDMGFKF